MRRAAAMVLMTMCAGCAHRPQQKGPLTQVVPIIGLPPITVDNSRPGLDVQPMRSAEEVAADERTMKVPADVASALLERRPVRMGYPEQARERHLAGRVEFRVIIGRDGAVEGMTLLQASDSVFVEIAKASVQSRQYRPYQLNGQPIAMDTMVEVAFTPPAQ
ncbi:MAG TPA: energy transducer TonB [Granulicella sp.]